MMLLNCKEVLISCFCHICSALLMDVHIKHSEFLNNEVSVCLRNLRELKAALNHRLYIKDGQIHRDIRVLF